MPNQDNILLQTNLHRPPITRDLIDRPRLFEQLNNGIDRPLTLVAASAGFGKTTLVSAWLEGMAAGQFASESSFPAAWLSLDENDSDPYVFIRYFIAALRTIFADACEQTRLLLQARQELPLSTLYATLGNEIEQFSESFILVLDDYHTIGDVKVHDLLAEWTRHWPKPLHLVLISRLNPPMPLASLRAKGQISEIRTLDLRFTPEEAAAYEDFKFPLSAYEHNVINELKSRLSSGNHGETSDLPRLIHQNYQYANSSKNDKYHQQMKASYGLSYLFTIVFMAIAVYFAMGFSHWVITLESQYKTEVNLWIGVIPVLIATVFAAIWGLPLAHQMLYQDDHEFYKGYDYRYKHSSNVKQLKLVSAIGITFMLLIGAWNGTNLMVFYQFHFTLRPSFLWLPPTKDQRYVELDHVSYRETLTDAQGKTIDYDHFILVYKDGKILQLKPYLSASECESVLVPYLDRKNIRLKP